MLLYSDYFLAHALSVFAYADGGRYYFCGVLAHGGDGVSEGSFNGYHFFFY